MARFARRKQSGIDAVALTTPDDLPVPAEPITCHLQVVAVTEPAEDDYPGTALISGLLRGPFPLRLVQFSTRLPPASWPERGVELAAMVDGDDLAHFGVTWSVLVPSPLLSQPITTTQWHHGDTAWDAGVGGAHNQAVATGLVDLEVRVGDLGDGPEGIDPDLRRLLEPEG